jgi:predicted MFS family arabinose efflux permease
MIASAFIRTPWQLALLWGGFSGVGTGMVASVLGVTVANRWFHERRSFVVGLFGASTSAGQLIFAPTLMIMASTIGWRWSSVALGGLALLALIPVIIWMRNEPAELGLAPLGATEVAAAGSLRAGIDPTVMHRAVRSSEFWLLCITFFICGATSNGIIGTHLIPHSVDHGIAQPLAAGLLALMGGMNFVGTLASGWLTDRYDPRKLLFFYYSFRGLSLFLLPFVTEPAGLAVFAILFGLDYIATVPPTTALVADNFGRRNVGTVYGWVFCAHQIGAASAAYLGGIARDNLGDYGAAFLVAGVRIGRAPKLAAAAGD